MVVYACGCGQQPCSLPQGHGMHDLYQFSLYYFLGDAGAAGQVKILAGISFA